MAGAGDFHLWDGLFDLVSRHALGPRAALDGAENLALAAKIATGTLPRELFYRAMLYPAVLAVPLWLRLLAAWFAAALAAILGLLCHFAIALGGREGLAARVWA